ncbi:hypothetical protein AQJ84_12680 [Streptomyces resistomycificus]|nr:hypothetical protein AQJ84_12680 [Streptomyces resistomycificus]
MYDDPVPLGAGFSYAPEDETAFGTLFSDRLESLGPFEAYTSAEALLACVFAPAGTPAVGAVSGLVLRRR